MPNGILLVVFRLNTILTMSFDIPGTQGPKNGESLSLTIMRTRVQFIRVLVDTDDNYHAQSSAGLRVTTLNCLRRIKRLKHHLIRSE